MPRKSQTSTNDQPKVDPGDSGATVGTRGDLSQAEASNAQVQERADRETEAGFVGVSSSPENDNEVHTFAARVEGARSEGEIRDTFTRVGQPSTTPTNAGEVVEAENG